jgi:hypothetical protein
LPARVALPVGPHSVIDRVATVVREARGHPVFAKILADERGLIGSFVAGDSAALTERAVASVAPMIDLAMGAGAVARRDPVLLAQWIVRITASLILTEPPGGLEEFLAELLLPALTPAG